MDTQRRKIITTSLSIASALALAPLLSSCKVDSTLPKIGYLPTTDHLLIIASELYPNSFEPIKFSSWADISQSFSANRIDGAFLLAPLALKIASQNINIKALFASHRDGSALIVGKGTQIDSISKLTDKKIAIPSRFSIQYLLLNSLLKAHHIQENDVHLIDMRPPEMLFALRNKMIDAYIVAEPFGLQAQIQNIGDILLLSKDIASHHICCIFCVNEGLYHNKQLLKGLVANFAQTADFITQNPSLAAEISQKFLGQKPHVIETIIKEERHTTYANLLISQDEITHIAQQMGELHLGNPASTDLLDTSIIETLIKGAK